MIAPVTGMYRTNAEQVRPIQFRKHRTGVAHERDPGLSSSSAKWILVLRSRALPGY
jgi:hypothetical protein